MRKSLFYKILPLLLLVMVFCTGCWDKKEFNQLAIAQTLAIDYTDETYRLTVQLVMPAASDTEISGDSMWLISGEGASVAEALEQISRSAPRELYLDHLDIVLLGEGLLRHDTGQGLAYLLKEDVLRRRTSLLAVQGAAGDLLQTKLKLADVDIYYLRNLLRDQRQWIKGGDTVINDYYLAMNGPITEGMIIPRIGLKNGNALYLDGAAVLENHRLLGWMEQERLNGWRWVTGGAEICTLPVGEQHENIIVEVRKDRCEWKLLSEEPLIIQANLHGTLLITENTSKNHVRSVEETEHFYRQIQNETEEILKEEAEEAFTALQRQQCDALRLGRWLYAWHPELVQAAKWPEQFKALSIEVQLETDMRSDA